MSPLTQRRFSPAYPAELRERGFRLFRETRADYTSDSAAYRAIAPKLGCSPDSLRAWCQQAERDAGQRAGLTSAGKDRIKDLEREVRDLRTATEILKKGETIFRHWSEDNGRTHISRRRSSTARSSDDCLCRRSLWGLWCFAIGTPLVRVTMAKADLPGSGDRPFHWPAGECKAFAERRPSMRIKLSRVTRIGHRDGQSATCWTKMPSSASMKPAGAAMAPARFGTSCAGRARTLPAARWND